MDERQLPTFNQRAEEVNALRKQELDKLMKPSEVFARRLFDACLTLDELKMLVQSMVLPQEAKAGVVRPDQAGSEVVEKIDLVLAATDLGNKAEALVANLLKDVPAFGGLRERVGAFALAQIAEAEKLRPAEDGNVGKVVETDRTEVMIGLSPEDCKKTVDSFRNLFEQLKGRIEAIDGLRTGSLSKDDLDAINQLHSLTTQKMGRFTSFAESLLGEKGVSQIQLPPGEEVDEQVIEHMRSDFSRSTYLIQQMTETIKNSQTDLTDAILYVRSDEIKQKLHSFKSFFDK